jgi:uncharacterized damage-inducible protein DinB
MSRDADQRVLLRIARHGLVGTGAHVDTSLVFSGLQWTLAGARIPGAPHTLYELLNHMIYWQEWVARWLLGESPPTPTHASGGWPGPPAPESRVEWNRAVRRFRKGLTQLGRQARQADLIARRRAKSPLEMLRTIGAHSSYHAGQAALMRRMLGAWPPPGGGLTW